MTSNVSEYFSVTATFSCVNNILFQVLEEIYRSIYFNLAIIFEIIFLKAISDNPACFQDDSCQVTDLAKNHLIPF